jgi:hypothetical protein
LLIYNWKQVRLLVKGKHTKGTAVLVDNQQSGLQIDDSKATLSQIIFHPGINRKMLLNGPVVSIRRPGIGFQEIAYYACAVRRHMICDTDQAQRLTSLEISLAKEITNNCP